MKQNSSQGKAPFYQALLDYTQTPLSAFHTPGHKRGHSYQVPWAELANLVSLDLTEISGLDWAEALEAATQLAASFYESDQSFCLVQGASQGIIAALLGCFNPGDKVLIARNCHLSVINGIILADLRPVFIEADLVLEWGIPAGVKDAALRQAVREHPDFKGLVLTSPTYQGISQPLQGFRELIGDRLLIIDEAHGGHLGWCGLMGYDASSVADLWVQGTHKIFGSLTQTGMLHLRRRLVNPERVRGALGLISTTSPSFVLLSSLDLNRRFLAERGRILFRDHLPLVAALQEKFSKLDGIRVLSKAVLKDSTRVVDPWKIALDFRDIGLSGLAAEEMLIHEFHIQPEYADLNQVTFFLAPWQDPADLMGLERAIIKIASRKRQGISGQLPSEWPIPTLLMPPRAAGLGTRQTVPLTQAVGRIAARTVAPYPPGIPLLVPGELIGNSEVDLIQEMLQKGGNVSGITSQREVWVSCLQQ